MPTALYVIFLQFYFKNNFFAGFERPTVSHLLQAAHLMYQQMIRGIPFKTATLNAFSDVYIKPRCGGDFVSDFKMNLAEMKNSMLRSLQKSRENFKPFKHAEQSHTLTIKGLCIDSKLELTNQILYPFPLLKRDGFTRKYYNSALLSLFHLFTAYQKCPNENFEIIFTVWKNLDRQCISWPTRIWYHPDFEYYFANNRNWESYKLFYPEQFQLDQNNIKDANRKNVLLFHILMKEYLQQSSLFDAKSNTLSAMTYSKAVLTGTLSDEFTEYPILKHCELYVGIIDKYIATLINEAKDSLNDQASCLVMQLLNWRKRFLQICCEPIVSSGKGSKKIFRIEEVVPLLYIHSKWVQKHLIGELLKLAKNRDLEAMFKKEVAIVTISEEDNTQMAKLGKKLRKLNGQPKLYEAQDEFDKASERTKLYEKITLDMNQPVIKQLHKLSTKINDVTDSVLALDVPDSEVLMKIQENLNKVDAANAIAKSSHLKLLPLNSYVGQRVFTILQNDFHKIVTALSHDNFNITNDINHASIFRDMLINLIHLGSELKGLSPALMNLLQVVKKLLDGNENFRTR